MNSFFFWLTIAAAIGALLATILRPGVPEIVIVVAVANAAFYGYLRMIRAQTQHA
ncbi:hypothetical protein U8335_09470 [Roseiconus lacunae]|uniref:hypothetical protein n=1 Tax=Roseiconus lacunae TaxID=2605694 RepID=UPI00308C6FB3|nr:hypothetical protein U8335_09470 [Stieleria sp. HD01]